MNGTNLWPENYCVNCGVLGVETGWRWEGAEKTKTWIPCLQKCLALPCGFPWMKDLSTVQEPELIHVVVLRLELWLKHAWNVPVAELCLHSHSLFLLVLSQESHKIESLILDSPYSQGIPPLLNLPGSWDYKPVSPGPGSGLHRSWRKRRELCDSPCSFCSKPHDWKKKVYFSYIFTPPPVI